MGQKGEITVDQAHRGYSVCTDAAGFASANPLFWKPTPSRGRFVGQSCYGYVSFEAFIDGAAALNSGSATMEELDAEMPTMATTAGATVRFRVLLSTRVEEFRQRVLDARRGEPSSTFEPTRF